MEAVLITLLIAGDIASSTGAIYSTSKLVNEYITQRRQEALRHKIQTDRDQSMTMAWEDLPSGSTVDVINIDLPNDNNNTLISDDDWTVV